MTKYTFEIETEKEQNMIDLTDMLNDLIRKSKLIHGRVTCFCPHTTAGLTINENADPDVNRDMINQLNIVFPIQGDYHHLEGNSHAHLKASFVGSDQVVMVENGKLILGTWQSVFFCEFDGPRIRKVHFFVESL